jgi:hypothetical protein
MPIYSEAPYENPTFEKFTYEKIKVAASTILDERFLEQLGSGPKADLRLVRYEAAQGQLIAELSTYMAGKKKTEERVFLRPKSWRAHAWKDLLEWITRRRYGAWISVWLQLHFPVDYEKISYKVFEEVKLCPHNHMPFEGRPDLHLAWLKGEEAKPVAPSGQPIIQGKELVDARILLSLTEPPLSMGRIPLNIFIDGREYIGFVEETKPNAEQDQILWNVEISAHQISP